MVAPFRIDIPQEQLDDLAERLRRTRFAPSMGEDWALGTPPGYLAELVDHWLHRYDWRAAESALNAMPQFIASIQDCSIHFVHQQGVGPAPMPLLFSHGWPGSFWEVHKILGPLTDPGAHGGDPADAFHVVAPSLPGYGFSPHPGVPGVHARRIAELFDELMVHHLGYPRYGAQGGDWGAVITTSLGQEHADTVAGIHLNMLVARPELGAGPPLTEAEESFVERGKRWRTFDAGYSAIQSTRPQTLAAGLHDSPAGLASWIVEKFRSWSDCDGDVESVHTKDELLTNVMLYWLTGAIGTSARLYHEAFQPASRRTYDRGFVNIPAGYANFPKELVPPPEEWVRRVHDLRRYTEFDRGGHFAALERPDALVTEIREFFRPLR